MDAQGLRSAIGQTLLYSSRRCGLPPAWATGGVTGACRSSIPVLLSLDPLPAPVIVSRAACALLFVVPPYAEELWRCRRAQSAEDSGRASSSRERRSAARP